MDLGLDLLSGIVREQEAGGFAFSDDIFTDGVAVFR